MVFKRRNPRSYSEIAREFVYPKGGFVRATRYVIHRMRRLPDKPHRIARGVFAGTFVNFPPIFGFQFASAALIAWIMRGNILAALLCTFLSNPITTPWIAVGSLALGHWMLGIEAPLDFVTIVAAFTDAGGELWDNFKAIFTSDPTHWNSLAQFFRTIYLPYMVGSIIPGLVTSTAAYYMTIPLIHAYQKIRAKKTLDRIEKRRALRQMLQDAEARLTGRRAETGDDDAPGSP